MSQAWALSHSMMKLLGLFRGLNKILSVKSLAYRKCCQKIAAHMETANVIILILV